MLFRKLSLYKMTISPSLRDCKNGKPQTYVIHRHKNQKSFTVPLRGFVPVLYRLYDL